jgi:hypothetical protein
VSSNGKSSSRIFNRSPKLGGGRRRNDRVVRFGRFQGRRRTFRREARRRLLRTLTPANPRSRRSAIRMRAGERMHQHG